MTQGKVRNNKNAELAVDKDLSTNSATYTDNGTGWLKLEFSKTYFIHKVVIYWRFFTNWYHSGDNCRQSETRFKTCVDDANHVDVSVYQGEVKQKSCGTLQLTYGLEQSDQIYTLLCNTEGNIVKLDGGTERLTVAEVAVTSTGRSVVEKINSNISFRMKRLVIAN